MTQKIIIVIWFIKQSLWFDLLYNPSMAVCGVSDGKIISEISFGNFIRNFSQRHLT